MFTFVQFSSEWKRLHHPSMNVDGDVAFFYEIYVRLHRLVEQEAAAFDEQLILFLLLYTENTVSIGLDGVYEYRYRSVGNVVSSWCEWVDDGMCTVRRFLPFGRNADMVSTGRPSDVAHLPRLAFQGNDVPQAYGRLADRPANAVGRPCLQLA